MPAFDYLENRLTGNFALCWSLNIRTWSANSCSSSINLTFLKEALPLTSWHGLPKSSRLGGGRTSWRDCSATFPLKSLLLKAFWVGGKDLSLKSGHGARRRPVSPSPWRRIRREPSASFRYSKSCSEATKTLPFPATYGSIILHYNDTKRANEARK